MKVLHVPFTYYPDPVGGTEIYVASLAKYLNGLGCHSVVAAPSSENASYAHEGVRVHRFAVADDVKDLAELYGHGDDVAVRNFVTILDKERPDIVHLHAFTRGVSLKVLREARRHNFKTVFTYHTPTVSCQRGTMMLWGQRPCDGRLDRTRCAACVLHGHGVSRPFATAIARTLWISRAVETAGKSGGMWTALRMPSLIRRRHAAIQALFAEADHLVAVCEWVRKVMLVNGVSEEKVTLCRQGLGHQDVLPSKSPMHSGNGVRRLVFLGRISPEKGPDVVLQALATDPDLPVTLDIYGVWQALGNEQYSAKVKRMIEADPRVTLKEPVPSEQIVNSLRQYDALVVPSQCLETGPLVVLESFAAGIPVIGTNLGGIAELVGGSGKGMLVKDGNIDEWRKALRTFGSRKFPGAQILSPEPQRVRSMRDVAAEMHQLYLNVLGACA